MKDIKNLLKDLTPQQKVDFLEKLLKSKKGREKEQIQTLIDEAKHEQIVLEQTIREFESRTKQETKEKPLENIIKDAPEIQSKEEPKTANNKLHEMYGLDRLQTKYLSNQEREKEQYKSEPSTFSTERFTEEQRKKLKKEEEDITRRTYRQRG